MDRSEAGVLEKQKHWGSGAHRNHQSSAPETDSIGRLSIQQPVCVEFCDTGIKIGDDELTPQQEQRPEGNGVWGVQRMPTEGLFKSSAAKDRSLLHRFLRP